MTGREDSAVLRWLLGDGAPYLAPPERFVAVVLAALVPVGEKRATTSIDRLAYLTGMDHADVVKALRVLANVRLITRASTGTDQTGRFDFDWHAELAVKPANVTAADLDAIRGLPPGSTPSLPAQSPAATGAARDERPRWCGRCDERTRQIEVDDDGAPARCPTCHPRAREAVSR